MRKLLIVMTMLLVAAPQMAMAQSVKVGVLSMQEVFRKSEPGQQAMGKIRGKFEDMKTDLEKRQEDLKKMREDLQKQSLVLSNEAKQDKELEFKRKVRYFQDIQETYKTKIAAEEERLSKPILDILVEIIEKYGKKHNYTVILDKNSQFSGLIYIDESIDITKDIIVELNREWRKKKN
ncbi:MAG: OmpH family outer membrane protein [Desulfovibrionaceae bacterium]